MTLNTEYAEGGVGNEKLKCTEQRHGCGCILTRKIVVNRERERDELRTAESGKTPPSARNSNRMYVAPYALHNVNNDHRHKTKFTDLKDLGNGCRIVSYANCYQSNKTSTPFTPVLI